MNTKKEKFLKLFQSLYAYEWWLIVYEMKWKTSNAPKSSVSRAQRRCKSESIIIVRLTFQFHSWGAATEKALWPIFELNLGTTSWSSSEERRLRVLFKGLSRLCRYTGWRECIFSNIHGALNKSKLLFLILLYYYTCMYIFMNLLENA